MTDQQGEAFKYHEAVSYARDTLSGHGMDWAAQPVPFKTYDGLPFVELPPPEPAADLFDAVLAAETRGEWSPDLEQLSRVLHAACGITARAAHGQSYFRSNASAGALYPNELYLALPELAGALPAGLYHYSPAQHGLCRLRDGDFAGDGGPLFFVTAIFFRSAWKYRKRAFRYHLLDAGHLVENLDLALRAEGVGLRASADFDDAKLATFLGLDTAREVPLIVGQLAGRGRWEPPRVPALGEEVLGASQVSDVEVRYDEIDAVYRASCAAPPDRERSPVAPETLGLATEPPFALPVQADARPSLSLGETIRSRRSLRGYAPRGMAAADVGRLLQLVCGAPEPGGGAILPGLLVGSGVAGLDPGFYLVDGASGELSLSRRGDLTAAMARVCLGQRWLATAPLHLVLLTDLEQLDAEYGPRSYRHAMLEAGRVGQRLYLAATALGLGACGIGAFFDGEAAELLGLRGGARLLYLVAAGAVR